MSEIAVPDSFDHDPTLEPYASMSREDLLAEMDRVLEVDQDRWFFLQEFLLDKMSTQELKTCGNARRIALFLMDLYGAKGNAQATYLSRMAGTLAALIANGMPPIGPPEQCN